MVAIPGIQQDMIAALVAQSMGVQRVRLELKQAEAELKHAQETLSELPEWAVTEILWRGEEKLRKLKRREKDLVEQAERTAVRELQEDYVIRLRAEAEPKLAHAAKALETARAMLLEVVELEREARANRGSVMTEAMDASSIRFFVPVLEYVASRGTWTLRRQN